MAGVLTPGGYASQNQFISEQFTQFVSRAKNQRVAVWLAPPFLEHGKTGRHVGIDTHMVEANRDPEEVLCEALRVLLRYVRETPQLGHWHEVLPGILHRPEKSQDASLLPAQELSTSTHIPASDEP
jgi:hypothetical protein